MWQPRGRFTATDSLEYDAEVWKATNNGRSKQFLTTISAIIHNQEDKCFACGNRLKEYKNKFIEGVLPNDMAFLIRVRIQDAKRQVAICAKCLPKIQDQRKNTAKDYEDKVHRTRQRILELQEVVDSIYESRGLTKEEIKIAHTYHSQINQMKAHLKEMRMEYAVNP